VWERHADLVLRPNVQSLAWDDFDRAEEAIEAGTAVTQQALPRIEKFLAQSAAEKLDRERESQDNSELMLMAALR
jgi:predicted acylesterase/phospholipase RssA